MMHDTVVILTSARALVTERHWQSMGGKGWPSQRLACYYPVKIVCEDCVKIVREEFSVCVVVVKIVLLNFMPTKCLQLSDVRRLRCMQSVAACCCVGAVGCFGAVARRSSGGKAAASFEGVVEHAACKLF